MKKEETFEERMKNFKNFLETPEGKRFTFENILDKNDKTKYLSYLKIDDFSRLINLFKNENLIIESLPIFKVGDKVYTAGYDDKNYRILDINRIERELNRNSMVVICGMIDTQIKTADDVKFRTILLTDGGKEAFFDVNDRKRMWINENKSKFQEIRNQILKCNSDMGYYINVNGFEISEDFFEEEYDKIVDAYFSVLRKTIRYRG